MDVCFNFVVDVEKNKNTQTQIIFKVFKIISFGLTDAGHLKKDSTEKGFLKLDGQH